MQFDRDKMHMADPAEVARATMTVIDRLQDFQPHVQIMGAAATFLALADFLGLPAQDVFTATKNLITEVDEKRAEFRAVDAYLAGELA